MYTVVADAANPLKYASGVKRNTSTAPGTKTMALDGVPATGATALACASAALTPKPRNTVLEPPLTMRYWPVAWLLANLLTSACTPAGAVAAAAITTVLPCGVNAICELVDMSVSSINFLPVYWAGTVPTFCAKAALVKIYARFAIAFQVPGVPTTVQTSPGGPPLAGLVR